MHWVVVTSDAICLIVSWVDWSADGVGMVAASRCTMSMAEFLMESMILLQCWVNSLESMTLDENRG